MTTTRVLVRKKPFHNGGLFTGPFAHVPITTPLHIIDLEASCSLWCFEFSQENNVKCCEYIGVFDIDVPDLTEEERNAISHNFVPDKIDQIIQAFADRFKEAPMQIFFSGKKGLHVYIQDIRFLVQSQHKTDTLAYLKTMLGDTLFALIDPCLYGSRCGIRPFTCAHPSTNVTPFTVYTQNEFHVDSFWYFLDMLVAVECWQQIEIQNPTLELTSNRTPTHVENVIETEGSMEAEIRHILRAKERFDFDVQNIKRTATFTIYKDQRYCFIADRRHKHSKCYWKIYRDHAEMKCFSDACAQSNYIVRRKKPSVCCFPPHLICKDIIRIPPQQQYISVDDVEKAYEKSSIMMVLSPMGTGKTYAFKEYKKKHPGRTLMIVTRKCQASYFAERFDMTNYLHAEDSSLYKHEQVVICLNSLPRVLAIDGRVPCFDYLLLDEIVSLIKSLTGHHLNSGPYKQRQIWDLFILLIRCSKKTLMMDGLPTEELFYFLEQNNILRHCVVIEHAIQPDQRTYEQVVNPYIFQYVFKQRVAANEKVVFVSTGKGDMANFHSLVKDTKNCFMINGDSSDEIKASSKNPDTNWQPFDVLFYNGAVGPGASFDVEYYDTMFVYIEPGLADPVELYQLICRIRSLKSKHVIFYIKKRSEKQPESETEIKRIACDNIVQFSNLQHKIGVRFIAQGEPHRLLTSEDNPRVLRELAESNQLVLAYESDAFLNCYTKNEHFKHWCGDRKRYFEVFVDLITRNGGLVITNNKQVEDKIEKTYNANMLMQNKLRVEEKGSYLVSTEDANAEQMTYFNKIVCIQNTERQRMFCRLHKAMLESQQDIYEQEFQKINQGKVVNNTCLFSQLVDDLKPLLLFLGLEYDTVHGYIRGEFSTEYIINHKDEYLRLARKVHEIVQRETKSHEFKTNFEKKVEAFQHVNKLFMQLGYRVRNSRKYRAMVNGQRKQVSFSCVDAEIVDIRNAIRSLDGKTMQTVDKKRAIEIFFENKAL